MQKKPLLSLAPWNCTPWRPLSLPLYVSDQSHPLSPVHRIVPTFICFSFICRVNKCLLSASSRPGSMQGLCVGEQITQALPSWGLQTNSAELQDVLVKRINEWTTWGGDRRDVLCAACCLLREVAAKADSHGHPVEGGKCTFLFVPSQGARMVLWFRIFEFGSQNLTLTHSPSKPLNFFNRSAYWLSIIYVPGTIPGSRATEKVPSFRSLYSSKLTISSHAKESLWPGVTARIK